MFQAGSQPAVDDVFETVYRRDRCTQESTQVKAAAAAAALTVALGISPAPTIPSQAPMFAQAHVVSALVAVEPNQINENLMWSAFTENLIDVIFGELVTHSLLQSVNTMHRNGEYIQAADHVLDFVVTCLDTNNMPVLDRFVSRLAANLNEEKEMYNDRGLARVINVLGLTLKASASLKGREALKAAYRSHVAALEGAEAARSAVAFL